MEKEKVREAVDTAYQAGRKEGKNEAIQIIRDKMDEILKRGFNGNARGLLVDLLKDMDRKFKSTVVEGGELDWRK